MQSKQFSFKKQNSNEMKHAANSVKHPLPDKDYADEQMEAADSFLDKLNDCHERQIESQFEREAGEVSF